MSVDQRAIPLAYLRQAVPGGDAPQARSFTAQGSTVLVLYRVSISQGTPGTLE